MLTAVIRRAQPLNKRDMHHLQIFFETTPFCHAYTNFYLSIKVFEIKDEFNLFQNLHLCTQKFRLSKLAESLLYNFHRGHVLLKYDTCKNVIAKI